MNMKKIISVLLIAVLFAVMMAGCRTGSVENTPAPENEQAAEAGEARQEETPQETVEIRIGGLKGPTSMGMVWLMESNEAGKTANKYRFTIAGSADELTPKLIQGELDMAAVPANLAAVLYNNTDKSVKLLAVNTLGVIYIVGKGNTVKSLEDLKGKTIYATGKGSVPEYALRYLLSQKGINPDTDVTIEWKAEPTETVALLKENESGIAMLPQPYVTVAQGQVEGLHIAVDLTDEWDRLENGSTFITGVLIARSEFVDKYPEQVKAFLEEYKKSTEYVNGNIPEAAQLIEKFDIFKAAVAEKAIPYCNITYMDGTEMKTKVEGYLKTLFDQNPKAVGGALPGEDFYYAG